MQKQQELVFLKGLPASGKSTWAKNYCVKNNGKRVNKDDLRMMVDDGKFSKENEGLINEIQRSIVIKALEKGKNIVVDNTHLSGTHEDDYKVLIEDYNLTHPEVKFVIKEFHTDVETCIERDKLRAKPVWAKVIREMHERTWWGKAPPEFHPVQWLWTHKGAFIFDIDGTLARMTDRSPYDYTKVSTDACYQDIADMARMLKEKGNVIIICSGRKSECRKETEEWLVKYLIPYDLLLMRKRDDNRKDSIVKYELLVEDITPHYYVHWVFDDRDQVVKMWREAGLRCYQVNYWNF